MNPYLVLLSDFGYDDSYAAVMRGAVVTYNPDISVTDATHGIPAHSIPSASYVLHTVLTAYPRGTVFVCVVDPGVGSERRELVAEIDGKVVVAPDNGLVTLASQLAGEVRYYRVRDAILEELRAEKRLAATTFDGRDLFSPVGARIAVHGIEPICREILDREAATGNVELRADLAPVVLEPGWTDVAGGVIHLDHFGNAITSIHLPDSLEGKPTSDAGTVRVGRMELPVSSSYSEVEPGEPLAYWGSFGFLEIAIREGSAADRLKLSHGSPVRLVSGQSGQD